MRLIKLSSTNQLTSDFTSYFDNLLIKKDSKIALKNLMVIPRTGFIIDDTNNNLYVSYSLDPSTIDNVATNDNAFKVSLIKKNYANIDEIIKECDRAFNQSVPFNRKVGVRGLQFYVHKDNSTNKTLVRFARQKQKRWDEITLNKVNLVSNRYKKDQTTTTDNRFDSALLSKNYFTKGSGTFYCVFSMSNTANSNDFIIGLCEDVSTPPAGVYDQNYYKYYVIGKNKRIYAYFDDIEVEITQNEITNTDDHSLLITLSEGILKFTVKKRSNNTLIGEKESSEPIFFQNYFINISIGNNIVSINNSNNSSPSIYYNAFHKYNLESDSLEYDENNINVVYEHKEDNYIVDIDENDLLRADATKTALYFTSNLKLFLGFTTPIYFINSQNGVFTSQLPVSLDYILPASGLTVVSNNLNINSFSSIEGVRQNIIAYIPSYEVEIINGITYLKYQDNDLQFIELGNEFDFNLGQLNIRILDGNENGQPLEIVSGGVSMSLLIKDKDEM